MIELKLVKLPYAPETELSIYNSINRIPFSIKIDKNIESEQTIYSRNFNNGNLVEFRFDKNTKRLNEITLVSFDSDSVKETKPLDLADIQVDHFSCQLVNEDSLEFSRPLEIHKSDNTIKINWGLDEEIKISAISNDLLIGLNGNIQLTTVILNNLNKTDVVEIFGF